MAQYFVTPHGDVTTLPDNLAKHASFLGYAQASPEQVKQHELNEKYSTGVEQLKTVGEAAASTLTFGLSTHLEKALGVDPEAIKAREETNPFAHGAGTVLGFAAPAIATGGASLLGSGAKAAVGSAAEFAAPSLISRLGGVVSKGAAGALEEAGLASRIAKGAGTALGSSAEAMAYTGGNIISEKALNPNMTASHIVTQLTLAGVLGGAAGGVLEAARPAFSKVAGKARDALGELARAYPSGEAGAGMINTSRDKVDAVISHWYNKVQPELVKGVDVIPREVAAKEATNFIADVDSLAGKIEGDPAAYSKGYRPHMKGIQDRVSKLVGDSGSSSADIYQGLTEAKQLLDSKLRWKDPLQNMTMEEVNTLLPLREIRGRLKDSLVNPEVWGETGSQIGKFNEAYSQHMASEKNFSKFLEKRAGVGGPDFKVTPRKLNPLKNRFDTSAEEAFNGWHDSARNLLDAADEVSNHIPSGGIDKEGALNVINRSGDLMQKMRAQGEVLHGVESLVGHGSFQGLGLGMLGHVMGGPAGAAIGAGLGIASKFARYAPMALEKLAMLERNNGSVEAALDKLAARVVSASPDATAIARSVGSRAAESYTKDAARIRELSTNPEKLHGAITQSTRNLQDHAPDTAAAVGLLTAQAVQVLGAKLPQEKQSGPLATPQPVNAADKAAWSRTYSMINNPKLFWEHAANGTLLPADVMAMKAAYPDHFHSVAQKVMHEVVKARASGKEIPYRAKQSISLLLGQDMDGSLSPSLFTGNQRIHSGPPPSQGKAAPKEPSSGASKLKTSERVSLLNPTQGE